METDDIKNVSVKENFVNILWKFFFFAKWLCLRIKLLFCVKDCYLFTSLEIVSNFCAIIFPIHPQ